MAAFPFDPVDFVRLQRFSIVGGSCVSNTPPMGIGERSHDEVTEFVEVDQRVAGSE